MKEFRLKKEAVQYFAEQYAASILELSNWKKLCVDIVALEEVEYPYMKFGHKKSDSYTDLSGIVVTGISKPITTFMYSMIYYQTSIAE